MIHDDVVMVVVLKQKASHFLFQVLKSLTWKDSDQSEVVIRNGGFGKPTNNRKHTRQLTTNDTSP